LAEVISKGHDCVITSGGIQSNHCRSTAALARLLGLDSYLLQFRSTPLPLDKQWEGNLLLSRLLGARIIVFGPERLQELGSYENVFKYLITSLKQKGRNPYIIPPGGTSALGCWGYMLAAEEILSQIRNLGLDIEDIVVATGTGSTVGGLALGMKLLNSSIRVHGVCVCNSSEYFLKSLIISI